MTVVGGLLLRQMASENEKGNIIRWSLSHFKVPEDNIRSFFTLSFYARPSGMKLTGHF